MARPKSPKTPDPWWKTAPAVATAIVAIVGVPTALYNFWEPIKKELSGRATARTEEFNQTIAQLNSTNGTAKSLAVFRLSAFLSDPDSTMRRNALTAYSALISSESDLGIQASVTKAFDDLPDHGQLDASDWNFFQARLVEQSRVIVKEGDIHRNRQSFSPSAKLSPEEQTAQYIRDMIARNIRKNVVTDFTDYHDIYCVACDFKGVAFAPKMNFSGAILDKADFSKADLAAANFDNAELDGSQFVETNLEGASFRSVRDPAFAPYPASTLYLEHAAASLATIAMTGIVMPDFSCANLRGAFFDGHTLFAAPFYRTIRAYAPAQQQTQPKWWAAKPPFCSNLPATQACQFFPFSVRPPKFYKADLSGAHFEKLQFFSIQYLGSAVFSKALGTAAGEFNLSQGVLLDTVWTVDPTPMSFEKLSQDRNASEQYSFQMAIRASFFRAQITAPSFPKPMADFLAKSPSTEDDYQRTFFGPFGDMKQDDRDADCTPRRSAK